MRARMTAQRKAIVEFIKEQGGVANTYAIQQEGLARTNAILHRMVDAGILIYVCSQYNYADRKREFLHIDEVPDAVRPELDRRIAETNQSAFWVIT